MFRINLPASGGKFGEVLAIRVLIYRLLIFFNVEENEPKEDAHVPLDPARRRCGRSARKRTPLPAGLKQVRALLSGRIADARRGTMGYENRRLRIINFSTGCYAATMASTMSSYCLRVQPLISMAWSGHSATQIPQPVQRAGLTVARPSAAGSIWMAPVTGQTF